MYLYGSSALIDKSDFCQNKLGGVLVAGSKQNKETNISVSASVFEKNGGNGLSLL